MSASPAPAPITEIRVSVPRPRVLLIDDDQYFLNRACDYFADQGYDVDLARTPEEAEPLLEQNDYQLVAADINFGTLSKISGDRFVIENRQLFGKAKRVLISAGTWLTPEKKRELESAEIAFVEKAATVPEDLAKITEAEGAKRAKEIKDVVLKQTMSEIGEITGTVVNFVMSSHTATGVAPAMVQGRGTTRDLREVTVQRMKRSLVGWLRTRGSLNEEVFAYGDKMYSAAEMIDHVEKETPVGIEHIDMMFKEFEESLESETDEGYEHEDDSI
jgi:CheY-like chemotaxis protein